MNNYNPNYGKNPYGLSQGVNPLNNGFLNNGAVNGPKTLNNRYGALNAERPQFPTRADAEAFTQRGSFSSQSTQRGSLSVSDRASMSLSSESESALKSFSYDDIAKLYDSKFTPEIRNKINDFRRTNSKTSISFQADNQYTAYGLCQGYYDDDSRSIEIKNMICEAMEIKGHTKSVDDKSHIDNFKSNNMDLDAKVQSLGIDAVKRPMEYSKYTERNMKLNPDGPKVICYDKAESSFDRVPSTGNPFSLMEHYHVDKAMSAQLANMANEMKELKGYNPEIDAVVDKYIKQSSELSSQYDKAAEEFRDSLSPEAVDVTKFTLDVFEDAVNYNEADPRNNGYGKPYFKVIEDMYAEDPNRAKEYVSSTLGVVAQSHIAGNIDSAYKERLDRAVQRASEKRGGVWSELEDSIRNERCKSEYPIIAANGSNFDQIRTALCSTGMTSVEAENTLIANGVQPPTKTVERVGLAMREVVKDVAPTEANAKVAKIAANRVNYDNKSGSKTLAGNDAVKKIMSQYGGFDNSKQEPNGQYDL